MKVLIVYMVLFFLITAATVTVGLGMYSSLYQCHGQCGAGNKRCQERCLDKGYCPFEQR